MILIHIVSFSFLTMTIDPEEQKKLKPLMSTMMYLQIPRILIKPTLEEIQTAFSQVNFILITPVNTIFDLCLKKINF